MPNHRYSSFDYCFNHFRRFKNKREIAAPANMERSCFQLAAYLASWGMFRASSFLLKTKSVRHFRKAISVIASDQLNDAWLIDCDRYDNNAKAQLRYAYEAIHGAIIPNRESHLTLVTKIMLGVFGNVPAFDDRFTKSMRAYGALNGWRCRFRSFNDEALDGIGAFYEARRKVINSWSRKTHTFDFNTGKKTRFAYSKAKIVDMIGFEANGRLIK
jgi:hypothetical protein